MRKFFEILGAVLLFSLSSLAQNTISGFITESKSGEVVIGSSVLLFADTTTAFITPLRGTSTNKFGFYSLPDIPEGHYFLIVRAIGHRTIKEAIECSTEQHSLKKDIHLVEEAVQLEGVTVEEIHEGQLTPVMGRIDVPTELIQKMPALGGEKDAFRVMQLLPGVKAGSEISSGLYVRGGSPDQNLVLLDGALVYNPYHLVGFLSAFNTDALLDVRLLKGSFPAEYGGRLSSVVDLTMREGTKEKVRGTGGINLINSRLTLEGPLSDNMTFMISGRRMYLDILVWLAGKTDQAPRYYFYDVNAKLNYALGDNDRVFVSGYFGRDVLKSPPGEKADVMDVGWGNSTMNMRWVHLLGSSIFTNLSLIYTHYNFNFLLANESGFSSQDNFQSSSDIRDIGIRADVQYFLSQNQSIKAGLDITRHDFGSSSGETREIIAPKIPTNLSAKEGSVYVLDEWTPVPQIATNIGVRLSTFDNGNFAKLEPRISLSYAPSDKMTLKSSFSIAHQFVHLVTRADIFLPTDVWFPSSSTLLPSQSWQAALGLETTMLGEEYLASIDTYYKDMKNLYEYRDDASYSLEIPLDRDLSRGDGYAYGLELFVNKRVGSFTGWAGYTLAWTRRTFPELNLGRPFYPTYDRRHEVSLVLSYKLDEKWELGATWVYSSGQAMTIPSGFYLYQRIDKDMWSSYDYVSERNGYRLPAYHRLDISLIDNKRVFGLESQLSLNLYNVYNHLNPFYVHVETDYGQQPPKPILKKVTLFPFVPTLGWSFKF